MAEAIASRRLGRIKRTVRCLEGHGRTAPLRNPGDADAGGDRKGAAIAIGHDPALDGEPQAFANLRYGLQSGADRNHPELFPADPGEEAVFRGGLAHDLRDLLQRHIAHGMAIGIIDALEVVEIDQRQREGMVVGALEMAFEDIEEGPAIG